MLTLIIYRAGYFSSLALCASSLLLYHVEPLSIYDAHEVNKISTFFAIL